MTRERRAGGNDAKPPAQQSMFRPAPDNSPSPFDGGAAVPPRSKKSDFNFKRPTRQGAGQGRKTGPHAGRRTPGAIKIKDSQRKEAGAAGEVPGPGPVLPLRDGISLGGVPVRPPSVYLPRRRDAPVAGRAGREGGQGPGVFPVEPEPQPEPDQRGLLAQAGGPALPEPNGPGGGKRREALRGGRLQPEGVRAV